MAGRGSGGEADEQEEQEVQEVRWLIEEDAEDERVRWWRGIDWLLLFVLLPKGGEI